MLTKSVFTEIKADTEKNVIAGYGSFFGNIDSHKDIVMQGAFTKTISENKNRIKILWQHDVWEPIGKPVQMYEDSKGLYFEAKISDTDTGKKAMQLIKDGVLNEMSIGYDTVKDEWDTKRNVRLLKEVKLYEISVVTFASNPLAQITSAKRQNIDTLTDIVNELKVGRMISNSNRSKIQSVIDSLLALLEEELTEEDEPQEEPDEMDGRTPKPQKSLTNIDIDPLQVQSILQELKKIQR